MTDNFSSYIDTVDAPARRVFLITPSDTAELAIVPKAIRADSIGVIVFRTIDSTVDVTMNVSAGETLPYRVQYVRAATTATVHGLV